MRGSEIEAAVRERLGDEMWHKFAANDLTDRERASIAAVLYGEAYLVNGKYVPPDSVEVLRP